MWSIIVGRAIENLDNSIAAPIRIEAFNLINHWEEVVRRQNRKRKVIRVNLGSKTSGASGAGGARASVAGGARASVARGAGHTPVGAAVSTSGVIGLSAQQGKN
ncbi:hypothetical protein ACOSP7_032797 [Xanthoceras sorbifolium]